MYRSSHSLDSEFGADFFEQDISLRFYISGG